MTEPTSSPGHEAAAIRVEENASIATVLLDGPRRHNVLDLRGWLELAGTLEALSDREDLRCVIVRGTGGRAFSAGSDIASFEGQRDAPEDVRRYSQALSDAMRAVQRCRHPTLAIIEGLCVGGGLEVAVSCDLRVCGASSRFGAPISRLGLTMSHDELKPLLELLGPGPVREILLLGELIDAERALVMGLVNRVWPDTEVVERGYALAMRIGLGAPLVNRWHKRFIRRLLEGGPLTPGEREEAHAAFETRDYREGRSAFIEKREPHFRGE